MQHLCEAGWCRKRATKRISYSTGIVWKTGDKPMRAELALCNEHAAEAMKNKKIEVRPKRGAFYGD